MRFVLTCEIAVLNAVSEELVLSQESEYFAEALFDHRWVATREMRVLKSFSSFEMRFNV